MYCEPSQGVGLTYFNNFTNFNILPAFFNGWNEKESGIKERLRQNLEREKRLRKEIYKERKKEKNSKKIK